MSALDDLSRAAGIRWRYRDGAGRDRMAPPETRRALLAAMGLPAATPAEVRETLAALRADPGPGWMVLEPGERAPVDGPWTLVLEDGTALEGRGPTPPLPMGRHALTGARAMTLLVAPPRLPLPPRGWGVTLPLYGLRPPGRGGIGDYADLARVAAGLGSLGAAFVGINPIHAGFPQDPMAFSPYSPSHRQRLNILHVATPGAPVPDGPLIDWPAATAAKRAALEAGFAAFAGDPAFDAFVTAEGAGLARFALHQALSEVHGPYWTAWPPALHDPDGPAARAFAAAHPDRLRFHAWAQWQAETQLARAAQAGARLCLDLAVGTHPAGAETWAEPGAFARGISLGAPPDAFSPIGQDWGIVPFCPRGLARAGFAPLAGTLRAQLRHAGMLRIDHVPGWERGFWVPPGLPGAYVTMPRAAMLAVARIEAARAGAVLVGEDLGTVPKGLRRALAASGLLGCRVAMFERDRAGDRSFRRAEDYDAAALASFGTHDLPPFAGWVAGTDIDTREGLGLIGAEEAARARVERAADVAAFAALAGGRDGAAPTRFLARAGSVLVALQVEDLLEIADQPNLPGTVHEYPNWRRRLPVGAEALAGDRRVRAAAAIMRAAGRVSS